jgi:hypothetical protein
MARMPSPMIHQMALKTLRPKIATRIRKRIAGQNIVCHQSKVYHPSAAAATPLAIIRGGRQCNANCFGEKGKGSKKRECLDAYPRHQGIATHPQMRTNTNTLPGYQEPRGMASLKKHSLVQSSQSLNQGNHFHVY